MLLPVNFVVSILTRHIETYGLYKMWDGLGDALADGDAEAVLVKQVDDGHEELAVVDLALDSKEYHGQAVANIDDVRIICVLCV